MAPKIQKRKCSECGKRRVPAKRSNGRLSTKCNECFGGLFWRSDFGRWFAEATTRQSPDSMPFDERDIAGIHDLWATRKWGQGWVYERGRVKPKHEYHICHRDAAKGEGYQGRFTTENLMVAPARVNQRVKNSNPIDHGHRVYTNKKPFGTAAKVRQWCGGQYNLNGLVEELGLTRAKPKKKLDSVDPNFLPQGAAPPLILVQQVERYEGGNPKVWPIGVMPTSASFEGALLYGIGLGSGKVAEAPLLPSERPSLDVDGSDEEEF